MSLTPAQTFARIEKAQTAWTRGGAAITVSSVTPQGASRAEFRLDLDGTGGATLRIKTPPKGRLAATDQAFVLRGNRILGLDLVVGESLVRPAPDRGPLSLRLAAVLGGIDDSVAFLTAADVRERYLAPMRALTGWKATPTGLVRTTGGAKASRTQIDVDAAGRLKGLHVAFPGSRLDWSIAYGPAKAMPLPRRLRRVEAFTARLRPPRYADASAKRVAEGMLRAGAGLRSAIVRIDGAATLWIDGPRVRYERAGTGYAYDGRILTLATPRAAYQGSAPRGAVIDQAAAVLGAVDPLARSVLVRTPPYADLFTPEARVRVVGTMVAGGQPCDVLAIDAPRFRASVFVRKSDRLPASIETEALDGGGNAVSRTTRNLAWASVGAPLPRNLFALRLKAGQKPGPLPKRVVKTPPMGAP